MREIRFRGWDIVGHKWVYGDLVHNKKPLVEEPFLADRVMVGGYEVDPESVGEFTGLNDNHGEPIYEGDIIYHHNNGRDMYLLVEFKHGVFGVHYILFNAIVPLKQLNPDNYDVVGINYQI